MEKIKNIVIAILLLVILGGFIYFIFDNKEVSSNSLEEDESNFINGKATFVLQEIEEGCYDGYFGFYECNVRLVKIDKKGNSEVVIENVNNELNMNIDSTFYKTKDGGIYIEEIGPIGSAIYYYNENINEFEYVGGTAGSLVSPDNDLIVSLDVEDGKEEIAYFNLEDRESSSVGLDYLLEEMELTVGNLTLIKSYSGYSGTPYGEIKPLSGRFIEFNIYDKAEEVVEAQNDERTSLYRGRLDIETLDVSVI